MTRLKITRNTVAKDLIQICSDPLLVILLLLKDPRMSIQGNYLNLLYTLFLFYVSSTHIGDKFYNNNSTSIKLYDWGCGIF